MFFVALLLHLIGPNSSMATSLEIRRTNLTDSPRAFPVFNQETNIFRNVQKLRLIDVGTRQGDVGAKTGVASFRVSDQVHVVCDEAPAPRARGVRIFGPATIQSSTEQSSVVT